MGQGTSYRNSNTFERYDERIETLSKTNMRWVRYKYRFDTEYMGYRSIRIRERRASREFRRHRIWWRRNPSDDPAMTIVYLPIQYTIIRIRLSQCCQQKRATTVILLRTPAKLVLHNWDHGTNNFFTLVTLQNSALYPQQDSKLVDSTHHWTLRFRTNQ